MLDRQRIADDALCSLRNSVPDYASSITVFGTLRPGAHPLLTPWRSFEAADLTRENLIDKGFADISTVHINQGRTMVEARSFDPIRLG